MSHLGVGTATEMNGHSMAPLPLAPTDSPPCSRCCDAGVITGKAVRPWWALGTAMLGTSGKPQSSCSCEAVGQIVSWRGAGVLAAAGGCSCLEGTGTSWGISEAGRHAGGERQCSSQTGGGERHRADGRGWREGWQSVHVQK